MHVTTLAVCSHIIPSDYTLLNTKHAITCMITSIPCRFHVLTPKTSLTCMSTTWPVHSISLLHFSLQKFTCMVIKQVTPCSHHFRNQTHPFAHAVCSSHFQICINIFWCSNWPLQVPLTCGSKGTCILIKETTSVQTLSMQWEQHSETHHSIWFMLCHLS